MKNKKNICLNCEYSLEGEEKFCPECGHNAKFQDLSLKHLFLSFMDNFLNFDAKLFKTFRDVWIPNKITKAFIAGKRKKYVHPFRFMFILLIIFFGLISLSMRETTLIETTDPAVKLARHELYEKFLDYRDSIKNSSDTILLDSINSHVFDHEQFTLKDTFLAGDVMGIDFRKLGISSEDAYGLSRDSLYQKYNITTRKDKLVVNQMIRVMKDPDQSVRFLIANMLWGIVLLTIILAGILYLLYIRHENYFVESVMHMIHYHVLFLIIMSLFLIVNLFWKINSNFFLLAFLIPLVYLFCNLKMYYDQSILKTLVKLVLLKGIYFISLMIVLAVISIISLFFF
ncbi:MAG: DUF3667 domain-containing protein [Saprospiraceae bacterium]|nr:DUF3667 domain-containing protein [Bacteroidia bacterium]NNK90789.1 DUF3667 domain-containing protein [Saprospiraceae bacterium]